MRLQQGGLPAYSAGVGWPKQPAHPLASLEPRKLPRILTLTPPSSPSQPAPFTCPLQSLARLPLPARLENEAAGARKAMEDLQNRINALRTGKPMKVRLRA